ncbi:MAG TPA: bifunctional hydroxymethylpyrimidine kinase/phosphomethylpyrimidine kinase [Labilithrix sp.]|nr:bifunctional hydroxymethylpyrimidine kinase/phosphomethylpyrimidine kinase [Labilithrix sp.]
MATPKASVKRAAAGKRLPPLSCVLAIGGLDPGGGAGVLADARAIARAGAFPCAAVAVLTVQSTSGLRGATPVARRELLAECTEVVRNQRVRAIKVGALGSEENTRAIADFLAIHRDVPAVVDTVMLPTRGRARLLDERAVASLRDRVVPRAALVTVNAPEAEVLTGRRVTRLDEAEDAVRSLLALGARAVLLKGGHLGGPEAVDLLGLAGTTRVILLRAPRLSLGPFHGGGCILASLIAGRLAATAEARRKASGSAVVGAVRWAKKIHHAALRQTRDVGGDLRILLV